MKKTVILLLLLVLAVGFLAVRGCARKKPAAPSVTLGAPVTKKKVVLAPRAGEKPSPVLPAQKAPEAKIAIILDDWGNNYLMLKYALDIGRPVTLSILPHLAQSRRIAEEAFANHLGVMLHMPMQPKNKIKGLEPHTILITTPDKDILAYLDSALESVQHAEGVNNHMGSAATSDLRVMRTVLSHLLSKGLFFVDSNTAPSSVAPSVAKELGIKFTKRDVFIDNDPSPEAIKRSLRRAKAIALKRGRVVVIGHDKKVTLIAIEEIVPEFEAAGIQFVLVKDLVE